MQDNDAAQLFNIMKILDKPKRKNDISVRSELEDTWVAFHTKPQEGQVEKAFSRGTKLMSDLLSEGKINSETAINVINHFVEMYVEYKVEKAIQKFLEKHDNRFLVNTLRAYIENE